ncbi:methylated-DNA--[protein]-cysteine S-methyltransferase [Paenibacillus psychroresistens]|uniref:Methylated-DNA--protein-cysteine methyltransferase n=1 Tax=Paenibacillus psychroresistens TaxID=1778678 RepID=A0A6B8RTM4_9BACL|nr:methylated-DNA--[protein]-cysteine S-methyltransferase [Paenibacillus psychroresistens]QGQ99122.1 methylated-DNA--[protein]-cysteine S-methyltransferase [Paenibacillus psychroresistens]
MGRTKIEVYWGTWVHLIFQNRPLYLAATKQGLCLITLPNESFETLRTWVDKKIPNANLIQNPNLLSEYIYQLQEYFEGTRKEFTFPIDFRGTAFQISVWEALTRVPYGQTRSYSELAEALGSPKAIRAVGAANGANPIPIVVPCHRVIGKNAALTGFRGRLQMKEELLQMEGFNDFTKKGHTRFLF